MISNFELKGGGICLLLLVVIFTFQTRIFSTLFVTMNLFDLSNVINNKAASVAFLQQSGALHNPKKITQRKFHDIKFS